MLAHEYRRFIRSTYRLADPALRAQFEQHVNEADVLIKGPYVTLARDFEVGATLASLVAEGLGPASLARLNWSFRDAPLWSHQERAFRAVQAGRNVVVTTGTGSGKTEAFLLPILADVLSAKASGVAGTKAILLYPMNALANDQLVRLRELVRGSGVPLTFALYTGGSEETSATLGAPLDGHELTRREDIRSNPPDIILTNYKQLEFLLVRKVDRPLFTESMRALVLDELHSYRGALATEIACLIRRLKARCGIGRAALRCIGTSATVSQDAGGDAALARFATLLFDARFEARDIIS
ncbi:MAG: DEAD/DEAH box helicase, partial [Longimicrobiales bacterium]